jgi:hypothetical protein
MMGKHCDLSSEPVSADEAKGTMSVFALHFCGVAAQLKLIYADALLGPVSVMFSTAREPIAAAGATTVSGRLAIARQATAPPAQYRRKILIGRQREVDIAVRPSWLPLHLPVPLLAIDACSTAKHIAQNLALLSVAPGISQGRLLLLLFSQQFAHM